MFAQASCEIPLAPHCIRWDGIVEQMVEVSHWHADVAEHVADAVSRAQLSPQAIVCVFHMQSTSLQVVGVVYRWLQTRPQVRDNGLKSQKS